MDKETINNLFNNQTSMVSETRVSDYKSRIKKIKMIVDWIYCNKEKINTALSKDLGKPDLETDIAEIPTPSPEATNVFP